MRFWLTLALAAVSAPLPAADPLLLSDLIKTIKPVKADVRLAYGTAPSQWADLYLPTGPGPHPVVVLIHGGCWNVSVPAIMVTPVADDLRRAGVAVLNVEYRRIGEPGGGYPGMYRDVAAAVDYLRQAAGTHRLDLSRVIAVGHSAGGHLALWAAARHKLPATSPFRSPDPLPIRAVVSIAGVGHLKANAALLPQVCPGEATIEQVVGTASPDRPDPYSDTSPRALLPTGVRTVSVTGEYDDIIAPYVQLGWRKASKRAGDDAEDEVLKNAAHFDVVALGTPAYARVRERILMEVARTKK